MGARLQWAGDRTCCGLTLCPRAVASLPGPRASLLSHAWALPPTLVRNLPALTNAERGCSPGPPPTARGAAGGTEGSGCAAPHPTPTPHRPREA